MYLSTVYDLITDTLFNFNFINSLFIKRVSLKSRRISKSSNFPQGRIWWSNLLCTNDNFVIILQCSEYKTKSLVLLIIFENKY